MGRDWSLSITAVCKSHCRFVKTGIGVQSPVFATQIQVQILIVRGHPTGTANHPVKGIYKGDCPVVWDSSLLRVDRSSISAYSGKPE